jgi:hypothetical protein
MGSWLKFLMVETDPAEEGAPRPDIPKPWFWVLVRTKYGDVASRSDREFGSRGEAMKDAEEFRRAAGRALIDPTSRRSSDLPSYE